jgi:hypothetical protein
MKRKERTIFNYKQGIEIQKEKIAELRKEIKMRLGEIERAKLKIRELKNVESI